MADLTITAASVIAGANAVADHGTAGETLTPGQAIYRSSTTGLWMKADNNSATAEARQATAIALNGAAVNQPVKVQTLGDVTLGATLTPGTAYFLSANPGGICPLGDLATGMNVCQLGLAKSASVLAFAPQNPGVVL